MFRKNFRERRFRDDKFSNDSNYIGMAENMKARHQINLIVFLSAVLTGLCAEAGCPPATPCGTPVSSSGSSGVTWSNKMNLGTTSNKPFPFEYDAYDIPDQFDVYKSNASGVAIGDPVWSTTTQVSGYKSVTIPYDASTWGTNYAVVKVTGNKDTNTQWTFTMGCPGGSIGNAQREKDRIHVDFIFRLMSTGTCGLTNLTVDKSALINTTTPVMTTSEQYAGATLSVGGPHSYSYSWTCVGSAPSKGVKLFFKDSAGEHELAKSSGIFTVQ